jgi:hypothetical protein
MASIAANDVPSGNQMSSRDSTLARTSPANSGLVPKVLTATVISLTDRSGSSATGGLEQATSMAPRNKTKTARWSGEFFMTDPRPSRRIFND